MRSNVHNSAVQQILPGAVIIQAHFLDATMPAVTIKKPPSQPSMPIFSPCSSSVAKSALQRGRLEKMI